jgi:hypothetical protein
VAELRFPTDRVVGTLDWPAPFDPETGPTLATGVVSVPDGIGVCLEVQSLTGSRPTGAGVWELLTDHRPIDLGFLRVLPTDVIESICLTRDVVESSASALAHLAPGLKFLYLPWSNLTDAVLPHVAGLTGLIYLQTFGNQFTDAGVQQLAALQALEQLHLEESTLSVAAFDFATHLPRLERLGVQDVHLSKDELEQLRSRLPRAHVAT